MPRERVEGGSQPHKIQLNEIDRPFERRIQLHLGARHVVVDDLFVLRYERGKGKNSRSLQITREKTIPILIRTPDEAVSFSPNPIPGAKRVGQFGKVNVLERERGADVYIGTDYKIRMGQPIDDVLTITLSSTSESQLERLNAGQTAVGALVQVQRKKGI